MNPDSFTNSEQWLKVGDGHQLYVQDWGNINAKNVIIFLHGGPGVSVYDPHKKHFDPRVNRVIFFDQRGAGKSLPKGSLKNNTTDYLVQDINSIADHFGLREFSLFGGSWGSCLALVYGIRNPERVNKMYLRGIFTSRKSEIEFLDQGHYRSFYPEVWEEYVKSVPVEYRSNPTEYHLNNIFGKDKKAAKLSAYAFGNMESSLLRLDDRYTKKDLSDFDPTAATIEAYYLKNDAFLEPDYVFKNAKKLTMPIYLVQGRYDMVCPPETAYELNKLLPNSKLIWTNAGHSSNERDNYDVLSALIASN